MIKYASVINEETGLCEVAVGTNTKFYESIGMKKLDVQQSDVDGNWYLNEKCPMKSEDEKLQEAKAKKYNEANAGARTYLESGNALFEFVRHAEGHSELVSESENPATLKQVQGDNAKSFHIEATDGNIAKLSAYALSFITGVMQPTDTVYWNTKEDETITLNQDELAQVLTGLGQVQALVWTVQFPAYVAMIESAKTPEEVNAIVIDYDNAPVIAQPESDEVKEDVL